MNLLWEADSHALGSFMRYSRERERPRFSGRLQLSVQTALSKNLVPNLSVLRYCRAVQSFCA